MQERLLREGSSRSAIARRRHAPEHPVLALQRSAGNAAVANVLARTPGKRIHLGSRGDRVISLQERLNRVPGIGTLQVDGWFGPKTLLAVRRFQKANGLRPDGIAGAPTLAALNGSPRPVPAEPEESHDYETVMEKDPAKAYSNMAKDPAKLYSNMAKDPAKLYSNMAKDPAKVGAPRVEETVEEPAPAPEPEVEKPGEQEDEDHYEQVDEEEVAKARAAAGPVKFAIEDVAKLVPPVELAAFLAHAGPPAPAEVASFKAFVASAPKYVADLSVGDKYTGKGGGTPESVDSTSTLKAITNLVAGALVPGGQSFREKFKENFGWTDEQLDAYVDSHAGAVKAGAHAHVTYLGTEDERKPYEVTPGGSMVWTHRKPQTAVDTSGMFAKASGAGNAIYVMDAAGRFYFGSHQVALFHHSSFLAAAGSAGAGDMAVSGGTVKRISNHSGHYQPTKAHLVRVIGELLDRGTPLAPTVGISEAPSDDAVALSAFLKDNKPEWLSRIGAASAS